MQCLRRSDRFWTQNDPMASVFNSTNKRQSEIVQKKDMKIFNVLKTILD
jgi:hypothetical protein